MSDFKKAVKTLEFSKIRELLAECAATEGAKETALRLTPESDAVRIKRMQAETSAARYLSAKKSLPSFSAVKDVGDSIEKARKKSTLAPSELLEVANVLRTSRELIDYIENGNIVNSVNYPACSMPKTTAYRLVVLHKNVSGMLAKITSVVGEQCVNISNMTNKSRGDYAVTLLDVDSEVSAQSIKEIEKVENIIKVREIK